jgi:hypothetical protein
MLEILIAVVRIPKRLRPQRMPGRNPHTRSLVSIVEIYQVFVAIRPM